jgi:hypothetical protein
VHIPFKSGQQATLEALAGRVPLTVAGVSNALPHLQSGRLAASLKAPATIGKLESMGFDLAPGTPAQLGGRMERDEAVFARVVRDGGIKAE